MPVGVGASAVPTPTRARKTTRFARSSVAVNVRVSTSRRVSTASYPPIAFRGAQPVRSVDSNRDPEAASRPRWTRDEDDVLGALRSGSGHARDDMPTCRRRVSNRELTSDGRPERDTVDVGCQQLRRRDSETQPRRRCERILFRNGRCERRRGPGHGHIRAAIDQCEYDCDNADEPHHPNSADTATSQPVNRGSSCDRVLGVCTMKPVEATILRTSGMDFGSSSALDAGGAPARYLIQAAWRASTE